MENLMPWSDRPPPQDAALDALARLATVAHDLRTPLQVLQLATSALRKSMSGDNTVIFDRMFRSIDAMKQMADSLLSVGAPHVQATTGKKTVGGGALLEEAVDMMQAIAERAGISLELAQSSDATIHVDSGQMLRVLGNLIGNSIKYSPKGSAIQVRGWREGALFRISVQDQGIGMNAAEQLHAFESGWQGAEGMVRGDGAGLGLAIAKTLVTEHGGSIGLSSETGAGTTATVSLPASEGPQSRC
jgi:signal transduction histidine kinase